MAWAERARDAVIPSAARAPVLATRLPPILLLPVILRSGATKDPGTKRDGGNRSGDPSLRSG